MTDPKAGVSIADRRNLDHIEVLALIQRSNFNLPLPRTVTSPRLLVATSLSKCCSAKSLLVRSKNGGYISQNCLLCGRSQYVHERDVPDLDCEGCPRRYSPIVPVLRDDNYWYECTACRRSWLIANIIPGWVEVFDYAGLAAPGDAAFV